MTPCFLDTCAVIERVRLLAKVDVMIAELGEDES